MHICLPLDDDVIPWESKNRTDFSSISGSKVMAK